MASTDLDTRRKVQEQLIGALQVRPRCQGGLAVGGFTGHSLPLKPGKTLQVVPLYWFTKKVKGLVLMFSGCLQNPQVRLSVHARAASLGHGAARPLTA